MPTIIPRPEDSPLLTAKEAIEQAKQSALAETMRLIRLNISHGVALLNWYPPFVADYLKAELYKLGYEVEISKTESYEGCLVVRWSPLS